jgi:lipoate-protein ligase A
MSKTWRLLDYSSKDPKMDWAVNEAIFRSRREGLTPDTLRLWQSPSSLVLGGSASYKDDIDYKYCQKYGVAIVRVNSVSADVLYHDMGSLNFAFAIDTSNFKQLVENYQPVLSDYQLLNECIAMGLRNLGISLTDDPTGIYVNNKKVSEALPTWFYDCLLFQGTIHVNTNLSIYKQVTKIKKALTTLKLELGKEIQVGDVMKALVHGNIERLGIKFQKQDITKEEQKLVQKLYRVKYSSNKWNVSGRQPFLIGMGKTAVEVFVAYPPTSRCRELINRVKSVTSDLQDEVAVIIWMRGRGIQQHGPRPEISNALRSAEKRSAIPAVIINGELKFEGSIPSREDLRKAILDAL